MQQQQQATITADELQEIEERERAIQQLEVSEACFGKRE